MKIDDSKVEKNKLKEHYSSGSEGETDADYPTGKYTDVTVIPIQGGSGRLSNGTGTYNSKIFACGDFTSNDHPGVGSYFNITAKDHDGKTHNFSRIKCIHSGKTSEFK